MSTIVTKDTIRKIILEIIGDAKEEYKFFGGNLVNGLRKDKAFKTAHKKVYASNVFRPYVEKKYGLKYLGMGYFRQVFEIPGTGLVIKFAMKRKTKSGQGIITTGSSANLQEVGRFNKYPKFFPKLYAHDPNGVWIITEKVKVITSEDEFNENFLKFFKPAKFIDESIKKVLLYYSQQHYEYLSTIATDEENAGFDFQKFENDITKVIMGDPNSFQFDDPILSDHQKIDLVYRLLEKAKESYSYEKSLEIEILDLVKRVFNVIEQDYLRFNLAHLTESDPEYMYFKFANSILHDAMIPLIKDFVVKSFLKERDVKDFFLMVQREQIATWDIRKDNVGLDENDNFKIIDATNFNN